MREIEFRGKDIETGEWKYGFYSQFHNRPNIDEPNIHQIFELLEENSSPIILGNTAIGGLWFTINENTLGQFTGLKDKNGTKIYEGDIVRIFTNNYGEELVFRIEYNNDIAQYEIIGNGLCITFDNVYNYEVEAIGNIYDNPELLESL